MGNFSEEKQQEIRKMDVESMAKVVFRHLKKKRKRNPDRQGPDRQEFYSSVNGLVAEIFSDANSYQFSSDYTMLSEAVTLLERRGLVVKDVWDPLRHVSSDKFIIYLTSVGINSKIDDDVFLLVDKPEEIAGKLEDKVGKLDPVVRQYYLESLRAYQGRLYISSVICLGAASERAIHWLAESIGSYSEKYQEKIKTKRNISDLTGYLSGTVTPNIFGDDKKFARELKERLDGVREPIS